MSLHLVTAPAREPVTLADLKNHLRVGGSVDDRQLQRLLAVVRQRAERATRRALITQTWDLFQDQWPIWPGFHGGRVDETPSRLPGGGSVSLPKAPLQSITYVKYTDLQGAVQTWASTEYAVDTPPGPYCARGRLSLGWSKVWPVIQPIANAVQIRMVCGYGDNPEDVPELLVQAMLLDAGTLYDTRASVLTGSRAAAIVIPSTSKDIYLSFRSL